jgi:hypothetical protein
MAATRYRTSEDVGAEADEILERLDVVPVPNVPLP